MTEPWREPDQNQQPKGMDTFVKVYLVLLLAAIVGAAFYFLGQDERVVAINDRLQAAPSLADYPYRFRVLSLEDGVATMTSPRTAEMGPLHFLRVLDPSLIDKDVVHPDMMAAQDLLVEKQSEAERLVREEPDVNQVRWELDRKWYRENAVFLPE